MILACVEAALHCLTNVTPSKYFQRPGCGAWQGERAAAAR